jgi:hypothetical protein
MITEQALKFLNDEISDQIKILEKRIESSYPVKLSIFYSNGIIILSKIVIEKESRNFGIGSEVMSKLCQFADQNNLPIALTPSSDFGGSKKRLETFYKKFGFVKNKGFETRESMIRNPK